MSNEISEEAKRTLADAKRGAACRRLERDGAHSTAALQRRVKALAAERMLAPAEIAKMMRKRISARDIGAFCEKHTVSYDWLLCGDLRGLQMMAQKARATAPEMPEVQRKEVIRLFSALTPRMQAAALGCMQELLTKGHL